MKFARFLKRGGFIAAVLIIVLLADIALSASGFIQKSGFFWLNDYEITRRDHPEEVWDRVIFGSSELVSAYREDLTTADYVNLGMDYGTVRDLVEMLEGGHITVQVKRGDLMASIAVRDTGIGLTPEESARRVDERTEQQ